MTSSDSRRPWTLLLMAAAFLVMVTLGIRQSFGLFLLPVTEALGTGREVFSLALALQNLLWGIASPFAGALADKFGAGRVAAIGTLFYAGGLVVMASFVSPSGLMMGQLMIGIGLGSAGVSIALGAVARAVAPEKRSLALGMVTSIGSFGQFAVLPVTQIFIDGYGWQVSLLLLSGLSASMLASCLLMARDEKVREVRTADIANITMNGMLKTALSSTDYLLLTVGFFVCGIQVVFIATHLPTYLQDAGIGPEIASWALGLVGLFNIIGSLLAGWLGSFVSKAKLLAWLYLMRSVIIIGFLILPPSPMTALLFGAAMGLLWLGTIPLTSGLIVVFFGPAFLSMLYGVTFFSHQIGSFLGAWLGGWIYDNLGSYDLMWWIIIGSGVFAFIINLMIDERPKTLTTAAAE
ncbi:MAG: MFS transporter [Alphaproteobacteria bacterium]|jgi:MFS family permease|nr:MFS transporter [Alphaproteobacteria bacterium]MBT4848330.1 MFS transporter [Alphaproteobacteria bacterium]MBT5728706.1 MFS transporter [Alphaproteobacteria bacterium]MBT7220765.1 MFS transporter [Alphaproteobacteria bacterium]MDA7775978.1 MFS transporter [Alphaproteobacteria bacterium]